MGTQMTKKVPYINIGAKINRNLKRDPKEAHQWEESTSHYFTWVATQTVKMYTLKVQCVKFPTPSCTFDISSKHKKTTKCATVLAETH